MANVAELPHGHALRAPDSIAVRSGGETWSYGELWAACARFGGATKDQGIEPGERVVLIAPGVPEFLIAYYGLLAAGAVVVTMNPMATSREIAYVIDDGDCKLVLAWHECAAQAAEAASASGCDFWRLRPGAADLLAATPLPAPRKTRDEDTAVILYTSGTTGRPKGAELSHRNLLACGATFTEVFGATGDDLFGTALPLFHIYGGAVIMCTAIFNGATLSLIPRFDAVEALKLLATGELTIFAGVPTMYNALLQIERQADLSSLRFCISGGASLPEEVLRSFEERFATVILEGYGLTECAGSATFNRLDRVRKSGSVGVALPGVDVRVIDGEGHEVGVDEVGEVVLRGPQVMKGYHGRPRETAEAVRDGWLHTGDLGCGDAEGDIRIVDRVKDLIISGGYNVYPREVEEVLYEHPDVVEAAVVGVEDPHFGEGVAAVIALRPGAQLDAEGVRAWVKERLSVYKAPRFVQFVDELPKGPTGKILKRAIDHDGLGAALA
jgi:long-chain acyl-CoA synthetase